MISEETFAKEERRLGKQVHFHDGVWWISSAPFYFKPVHEYRPFARKSASPHPLKALLGYSHQVLDSAQATRYKRVNVLTGEDLKNYSLERLKGTRRRTVRVGTQNCRIEVLTRSKALLEQMRLINISNAKKFETTRSGGTYLPAEYYERNAAQWREGIQKIFSHQGHQFIGAFVGETLAAYIDLIQIEDTWMIGAVKSCDKYLQHRPVDALYFRILSMASQCGECKQVLNGGPEGEPEGLTHFKEQFLFRPVALPYYSQTLLPIDWLRALKNKSTHRGHASTAAGEEAEEKPRGGLQKA